MAHALENTAGRAVAIDDILGSVNEKIGIVWNPSKVEEPKLRSALDRALNEAFDDALTTSYDDSDRPECLWFETSREDPGGAATERALAEGCSVVVAVGGDGTVRAVAERLGESGTPAADLGIVPFGTGNLLARNLGVPLGDPQAAFERILAAEPSSIDLCTAALESTDGKTRKLGFVVMAGFGIDAQMIVETDDDLKAKTGWLAYVESLGRAASGAEVVEVVLRLDGEEPRSERAHTMLVANCGSLQGGVTLLPDARPDDGEVDLLLLRADNAAAWLDTMKNMVWDNGLMRLIRGGDAESSGSADHLRARTLRAELPQPLIFEVDGDDVGEVTAFEIEVLPQALRVR